jgi:hypothetical protein
MAFPALESWPWSKDWCKIHLRGKNKKDSCPFTSNCLYTIEKYSEVVSANLFLAITQAMKNLMDYLMMQPKIRQVQSDLLRLVQTNLTKAGLFQTKKEAILLPQFEQVFSLFCLAKAMVTMTRIMIIFVIINKVATFNSWPLPFNCTAPKIDPAVFLQPPFSHDHHLDGSRDI